MTAIRVGSKFEYRDHTSENFKFLNILKLNELHNNQTSIYLYRTLFYNYDQELNTQLIIQSNVHTLNSLHNFNFTITRFKKTRSQCHMLYRGVKIFNSVPQTSYRNKTRKLFNNKLSFFY